LHYDRPLAGIRRAFIPAFFEIGFSSGEQTRVNLAANRAARLIQIKRVGRERC